MPRFADPKFGCQTGGRKIQVLCQGCPGQAANQLGYGFGDRLEKERGPFDLRDGEASGAGQWVTACSKITRSFSGKMIRENRGRTSEESRPKVQSSLKTKAGQNLTPSRRSHLKFRPYGLSCKFCVLRCRASSLREEKVKVSCCAGRLVFSSLSSAYYIT